MRETEEPTDVRPKQPNGSLHEKGQKAPLKATRTAAPVPLLKFAIPGPDEPGFIRRQRAAQQHITELKSNPGVAAMDAMIDFLLDFVSVPEDRDAACELLLDISKNEYQKLLRAILQDNEDFLP